MGLFSSGYVLRVRKLGALVYVSSRGKLAARLSCSTLPRDREAMVYRRCWYDPQLGADFCRRESKGIPAPRI